MTLSTRPSVSGPTGTITGCPRLIACIPRTRPSVGWSAIVRTRPSPICCCASQMMSIGSGTSKPSLVMRMAMCTSGICPSGNSQSTAGPATWTTLPVTTPIVDVAIRFDLLRGGGAADYFDNFLGDARLADAVHKQGQLVDHFTGVRGGCVHGRHARGMLRRGRFQQRTVKLHLDVARQQGLEHLGGRLLVQIIDGR